MKYKEYRIVLIHLGDGGAVYRLNLVHFDGNRIESMEEVYATSITSDFYNFRKALDSAMSKPVIRA